MKCLVRSVGILFVFCIGASLAFYVIVSRQRDRWEERNRVVHLVKRFSADQVSECILRWREKGIQVTLKQRPDIEKLVAELKAIKVDLKDMNVPWEGDEIIVILGENRSTYERTFTINGIGFSNPPPYISPSLRSATLGWSAIEFCRRLKDEKPTVHKRTHP